MTTPMDREDVLVALWQTIGRNLIENNMPCVFRRDFRVDFADAVEHPAAREAIAEGRPTAYVPAVVEQERRTA